MIATHQKLVQEAARMTAAAEGDSNPSSSKRRRAREARKLESRVKAALEEGRIEEDIKGVRMEKVYSRASTKQAMIARVSATIIMWDTDRMLMSVVIATTRTRAAPQSFPPLRRELRRQKLSEDCLS
jgi:hypothetical protein